MSRAPVTTRREAQGSEYSLEPIHYVINPPYQLITYNNATYHPTYHLLQPQQTARTHNPRTGCPTCEKSVFVHCSDLSRLYPLINEGQPTPPGETVGNARVPEAHTSLF